MTQTKVYQPTGSFTPKTLHTFYLCGEVYFDHLVESFDSIDEPSLLFTLADQRNCRNILPFFSTRSGT